MSELRFPVLSYSPERSALFRGKRRFIHELFPTLLTIGVFDSVRAVRVGARRLTSEAAEERTAGIIPQQRRLSVSEKYIHT